MTLLLALLLANPLDAFEPFVGEQWISSTRLPNGEEMRDRTVWDWGINKKLVRLRNFVSGKKGEIQRYETIIYFDLKKKSTVYQVFSESGRITSGIARKFEKGIALQQAALESFPAMRTAYDIPEEGICRVRIAFKGQKEWIQRVETKLRRVPIEKYKQLELRSGASPLDDLGILTGTRTWTDGKTKVETAGAYRLNRTLLHRKVDRAAEQYFSFDPRTGKPFGLEIRRDGTITQGPIEVVEKTVIWTRGDRRDLFDARRRTHRHETWKNGAWTLVGKEWTTTPVEK